MRTVEDGTYSLVNLISKLSHTISGRITCMQKNLIRIAINAQFVREGHVLCLYYNEWNKGVDIPLTGPSLARGGKLLLTNTTPRECCNADGRDATARGTTALSLISTGETRFIVGGFTNVTYQESKVETVRYDRYITIGWLHFIVNIYKKLTIFNFILLSRSFL